MDTTMRDGRAIKERKRAVIYTRVSRDDTGEGKSVARQLEACRAMCVMRGWAIVGEEDETGSAWSGKLRPVWQKVMQMIADGLVDVVVSWAIDRMTRSMTDLEQLILLAEEKKVGVAVTTGDIDLTTDVGRMVARILAAVARQEVERKAARQKLANEQRRDEGLPFTGGPRAFGYTQDGMSLIEDEAEVIREIANLLLAGEPAGQIANNLIELGYVSSRAAKSQEKARKAAQEKAEAEARGEEYTEEVPEPMAGWTGYGIVQMLQNPRYAGIHVSKGEHIGMGAWPAILDMDTHLALKRFLSSAKRRFGQGKTGRTPATLWSGIAVCGVCKDAGVIKTVNAAQSNGRYNYTCRPQAHTSGAARDAMDAYALAIVVKRLLHPDAAKVLVPSANADVEEARQESARWTAKLDQLREDYEEGEYERDEYMSIRAKWREKKDAADEIVTAATNHSEFSHLLGLSEEQIIEEWHKLGLAQQRALLKALVAEMVIYPTGKRGRGSKFDPRKHTKVTLRAAVTAAA